MLTLMGAFKAFTSAFFLLFALILVLFGACVKSNVNGTIAPFFAVSDVGNNRVLIWRSFPNRNGQPPDLVLGQPDFSSVVINNTPGHVGTPSAQSFYNPGPIASDGQRFVVSDINNNRALVWNHLPTVNQQPADFVLGQSSFSGGAGNAGLGAANAVGLAYPDGANIFNNMLFIGDNQNGRVLVWNSFSYTGQPADYIIGQTSFSAVPGPVSQTLMLGPQSSAIINGEILVADSGAHRALIWNPMPTATGATSTIILGQSTPTGSGINGGAGASNPTAQSFYNPTAPSTDGQRVYICDSYNNRILIWNAMPTVNQQPADLAVGQSSLNARVGGTTANSFQGPASMFVDSQHMIVADSYNNRVLIWNSLPTTNLQPADVVIGQTDFQSSNGLPSTMNFPLGIYSNWAMSGVQRPTGY